MRSVQPWLMWIPVGVLPISMRLWQELDFRELSEDLDLAWSNRDSAWKSFELRQKQQAPKRLAPCMYILLVACGAHTLAHACAHPYTQCPLVLNYGMYTVLDIVRMCLWHGALTKWQPWKHVGFSKCTTLGFPNFPEKDASWTGRSFSLTPTSLTKPIVSFCLVNDVSFHASGRKC